MYAFLTLLSPFAYLRVKHPLKSTVDLWFPIIGLIMSVVWMVLWRDFNLFGSSGAIPNLNSLLQNLPGFYITSLAAIATFQGTTYKIDDVLEGEKAILDGEALTRRQLLCYLFSYLSLLSLVLYIFGAAGIAAASTLHGALGEPLRLAFRLVFSAMYAVSVSHALGTTLIGLIFLSGRIPRSKPFKRYVARSTLPSSGQVSVANTPPTPAIPDAPTQRP